MEKYKGGSTSPKIERFFITVFITVFVLIFLFSIISCTNKDSTVAIDKSITSNGLTAFTKVQVGDIVKTKITFYNSSSESKSISLLGDSSFSINISDITDNLNCYHNIVISGLKCTYEVYFAPSASGAYSANLTFNGESIILSGTGVNPGILTLSQNSTDLGSYNAGDTKYFSIIISNTGSSPMAYPEMSTLSGLTQTSNTCESIIYPEISCEIFFSYKKTVSSTFSDTFTITYLNQINTYTLSGITAPLEPYGDVSFQSPIGLTTHGSTMTFTTNQILDIYGNIIADGTIATVLLNNLTFTDLTTTKTFSSSNGYITFQVINSGAAGQTGTISLNITNSYGLTHYTIN